MATWNDETPDPDFEELSKVDPDRAKEQQKQEAHGDPLKEPAEAEDYNFDKLDVAICWTMSPEASTMTSACTGPEKDHCKQIVVLGT